MAMIHATQNKTNRTPHEQAIIDDLVDRSIKARKDLQKIINHGGVVMGKPDIADWAYLHAFNCPRCGNPGDEQGLCKLCVEEKKTIRTTVTDFDATMPCPWCDAEGPHFLREAHPAPKFEHLPELQYRFAAFKKDTGKLEHGYNQYVRKNADVVIEGFGQKSPVRVIMNDPAIRAHAQTLRPPRVSLDSPKLSKYDHPEAKTIRTCTNKDCGKEWSQK